MGLAPLEAWLFGVGGRLATVIAGAILPASLQAQNRAQPEIKLHTTDTPIKAESVLLITAACSLAGLVVIYRFNVLKRASRRARSESSKRIRETDDVTDQLLQGVQGLLLTFHVAAQNISEDHASKRLMDHALSEADELVSMGRRRFERVAFQAAEGNNPICDLDAPKNNYL